MSNNSRHTRYVESKARSKARAARKASQREREGINRKGVKHVSK